VIAPTEVGSRSQRDQRLLLIRVTASILIALVVIRVAWIADDSLITLRTALNLANGFGAGFNPDESIQAYTHPLWFLLWLLIGTLTSQWILGILVFGIACTTASVWVIFRQATEPWLIIAAFSALVFSNAFIEYAASGLENPLSYLLLGVATVLSWRISQPTNASDLSAFLLGISWAGIMLTRADLVLFILPLALYIVWSLRNQIRSLLLLLLSTLIPLIVWYSWSYTTYGSVVPNTFAAKRNVDISFSEILFQGVRYIVLSVAQDPWTGIVLIVGITGTLLTGATFHKISIVGVIFYLAYVLYIGGDFMSGRFLAVPVYVTVLSLVMAVSERDRRSRLFTSIFPPAVGRQSVVAVALFGVLPLLVFNSANQPPTAIALPTTQRWDFGANAGIADERGFSVEQGRSLFDWYETVGAQELIEDFSAAADANARLNIGDLRELSSRWAEETDAEPVMDFGVACGGLGSLAMSTGPLVHWVDPCGLTDGFLASLPYTAYNLHWRAGHFERDLPAGYLEALQAGDPGKIADPQLAIRLRDVWERIRS